MKKLVISKLFWNWKEILLTKYYGLKLDKNIVFNLHIRGIRGISIKKFSMIPVINDLKT